MDLLKELNKKNPTLRGVLNLHIDAIKQGLEQGYTKKEVYNKFIEKKLIQSDYFYFVKILNQILNSDKSAVKNKSKIPSNYPEKKSFQMVDLDDDDFK